MKMLINNWPLILIGLLVVALFVVVMYKPTIKTTSNDQDEPESEETSNGSQAQTNNNSPK
jgi:Tfp pilus assembly protein PilO